MSFEMTSTPTPPIDVRRRRALYRARHRGTMEMDWFLGRFAEARLPDMSEEALGLFERLLAMPDPDLQNWITAATSVSGSDFAGLIGDIRAFHGLVDGC
jgi:antitoxin CptB